MAAPASHSLRFVSGSSWPGRGGRPATRCPRLRPLAGRAVTRESGGSATPAGSHAASPVACRREHPSGWVSRPSRGDSGSWPAAPPGSPRAARAGSPGGRRVTRTFVPPRRRCWAIGIRAPALLPRAATARGISCRFPLEPPATAPADAPASSVARRTHNIRNMSVIAHVDHGERRRGGAPEPLAPGPRGKRAPWSLLCVVAMWQSCYVVSLSLPSPRPFFGSPARHPGRPWDPFLCTGLFCSCGDAMRPARRPVAAARATTRVWGRRGPRGTGRGDVSVPA